VREQAEITWGRGIKTDRISVGNCTIEVIVVDVGGRLAGRRLRGDRRRGEEARCSWRYVEYSRAGVASS